MKWENQKIKENHIKFDISIWKPENIVWLNNFIIPKKSRGKGLGKEVLKEFTQWLDANHYNSKLLIADCYGTPESVLENLYGSFGYTEKEIIKNNTYLIRKYIDK